MALCMFYFIRSNNEDIVCCTGINVNECLFKLWDQLTNIYFAKLPPTKSRANRYIFKSKIFI